MRIYLALPFFLMVSISPFPLRKLSIHSKNHMLASAELERNRKTSSQFTTPTFSLHHHHHHHGQHRLTSNYTICPSLPDSCPRKWQLPSTPLTVLTMRLHPTPLRTSHPSRRPHREACPQPQAPRTIQPVVRAQDEVPDSWAVRRPSTSIRPPLHTWAGWTWAQV
jgi:hypothetical protein